MKKALFIFISIFNLFINTSFAQESEILQQGVENSFEKVFDVSGKNKDEIFKSIKSWVIKNVKTQSNSNFFDDTEKNSASTNPAFTCAYGSSVDFKLNFEIKDGKYRISANSFIWHNNEGINKKLGDFSGLGMFKGAQKKVMKEANESFHTILSSIETSVKQSSEW